MSTCSKTEEAKKPKISKEFILFTLDKFRKLDLRIEKNKERLIDGLVKAIIVYDDHFKVFLTFDDTPITIPTSEEIESMKNSSDIASVTSPNKTNPNYFAGRNWFGFVFCEMIPVRFPASATGIVRADFTQTGIPRNLREFR